MNLRVVFVMQTHFGLFWRRTDNPDIDKMQEMNSLGFEVHHYKNLDQQ